MTDLASLIAEMEGAHPSREMDALYKVHDFAHAQGWQSDIDHNRALELIGMGAVLDAKLPGENIWAAAKTPHGWTATHAEDDGDSTFTFFHASAHTEPLARRTACLRAREAEG